MKSKAKNYFSTADTDLFKDVMNKQQASLANNKMDAQGINNKANWQAITKEFNGRSSCYRTTQQLKCRWSYLKRSARKTLATSDGETRLKDKGAPSAPLSDNHVWLQDILKESMSGLTPTYDRDDPHVTVEFIDMNVLEKEDIIETEQIAEEAVEVFEEQPFKKRQKPTSARPRTTRKRMCTSAEEKTKYINIRGKKLFRRVNSEKSDKKANLIRREEHEEKRREENHQLQMELMKKRYKIEEDRFKSEERRKEQMHVLEIRMKIEEHEILIDKMNRQ